MFQGPDEEEERESCSGGSDIQMAFPHQVDQIYANCNSRVFLSKTRPLKAGRLGTEPQKLGQCDSIPQPKSVL